jgi:hypothetical protein
VEKKKKRKAKESSRERQVIWRWGMPFNPGK